MTILQIFSKFLKYTLNKAGVTIIELSVVIIILGILGTILLDLSSQISSNTRYNDTQKKMDYIIDIIKRFAEEHGTIPAPSEWNEFGSQCAPGNNTGSANQCASLGTTDPIIGGLPTDQLSLPRRYTIDEWGNRFIYAVNVNFTRSFTHSRTTLQDTANGTGPDDIITIQDAATTPNMITNDNVVFVLISTGENAFNARNSVGTTINSSSTNNASERENTDGDAIFISDSFNGNYDDITHFVPAWMMNKFVQSNLNPSGSGSSNTSTDITYQNAEIARSLNVGGIN